MRNLFLLFICCLFAASCQTVKPYQRVYLNDYEMRQGKRPIDKMEDNVHTYREGATGGGAGKTSGGCGCN